MTEVGNWRTIIPENFAHQPFIISNGEDLTKPTRAVNLPMAAASASAPINISLANSAPAASNTDSTMKATDD